MNYSTTLKPLLLLLLCVLFFQGCFGGESGLPEHMQEAKNLSVLEDTEQFDMNFKLEKVMAFEDSLLLDHIHDIVVDNSGRVYIAGEGWNRRQVHIFEPDGSYADSLRGFGQGFGEFQSIDHIRHLDNILYLFDHTLNRVSLYQTQTKSFLDTLSFNISQLTLPRDLKKADYEAVPVSIITPNRYVVALKDRRNPAYEPEGTICYFLSDSLGILSEDEIVRQPDLLYQVGDYAGKPSPFTLSLPERPLFYVSNSNELYTVYTAEFFIRVFDEYGIEERAFYYPFSRETLNPDDVIHPRYSHNRQLLMTRGSADYPDQWPALFSLLVDDKNRLWVSTTTENQDEFVWWVIDQTSGEVVVRFNLPAEELIAKVENKFAYIIKKNEMGFREVVKYSLIENSPADPIE